jgi:DNA-binding response OmpR family regulator
LNESEEHAMRVLVVEDEVRLAATLQDLLELNGYTADVCHDGESGLDNALSSIYDVILLDVMLPKLDGFTVLRRLRAEGNPTPVLMLTAKSETADKVTGLDSGADYYLTKPFEPKELLACVRALTRRHAGAADNGRFDLRRSAAGAKHLHPLLRREIRAPEPQGV